MFGPCLVIQCLTSFLVLKSSDDEKSGRCLLYFNSGQDVLCWCSVVLLRGTVDCSAVCDCGIS